MYYQSAFKSAFKAFVATVKKNRKDYILNEAKKYNKADKKENNK